MGLPPSGRRCGRPFNKDAPFLDYGGWAKKQGKKATPEGYEQWKRRYFREVVGVELVAPGSASSGVQVSAPPVGGVGWGDKVVMQHDVIHVLSRLMLTSPTLSHSLFNHVMYRGGQATLKVNLLDLVRTGHGRCVRMALVPIRLATSRTPGNSSWRDYTRRPQGLEMPHHPPRGRGRQRLAKGSTGPKGRRQCR